MKSDHTPSTFQAGPFVKALLLILLIASPNGQAETLTISTNNTPLDRMVLDRLSQEAFRRIGLEFRLISLPSERSLTTANSGEIDGEGLRVAGLSTLYPDLIQVPERYTRISFVAFSRDASIQLDQGWKSLKPYRVAFITGWKMFEANASTAQVVTRIDQPEQMFKMLDAGRIDLALYTLADGLALIRKMGFSSLAPLSPVLKDVDMYLYLHKRHQDLIPKLTSTLKEMKRDGSYNRILSSLAAEE